MIFAVYRSTDSRVIRWCDFEDGDPTQYPLKPGERISGELPDMTATHIINGEPVTLDLTAEVVQQKIQKMVSLLEGYYDEVAKAKNYDSRYTCALRAGYVSPFQAEGIAFATWMDSCNAYGYGVIADCTNSLRAIPTFAELKLELPIAPW